jgi:DNA-3-methyladenine glycosylase
VAEVFSQAFFRQGSEALARKLLGQRLVHIVRGKRLSGIIVETEAYLGVKDAAAHSFGGRKTPRTLNMYRDGGHAYVYFIYGMHFCFNVVARDENTPEAVLIRALQPEENIEVMMKNRTMTKLKELCNGPGKLCEAMAITKNSNGLFLTQSQFFIERARSRFLKDEEIVSSPRVGVAYAGTAASWPLRFSIRGNEFVSKPRPEKI